MSLTGKIINLFTDKENTNPIFPRTKVKAVSDDNGVGLDATLASINNSINTLVTHTHSNATTSKAGFMSASDKTKLDSLGNLSLLDVYPIGSIYMSVNSTNPEILFGGTWAQLKDRFLLGASSTYSAGTTGGEAAVTLTEGQMPEHIHGIERVIDESRAEDGDEILFDDCVLTINEGVMCFDTSTTSTGGNEAHNNMPPYLAVYMWKRTA